MRDGRVRVALDTVDGPWSIAGGRARGRAHGGASKRACHVESEASFRFLRATPCHNRCVEPSDRATVLCVDDSAAHLKLLELALRSLDYGIDVAHDGMEAWERLSADEAERPVALVVDVEMPRMDGLELTRRLRSTALYADMPIVVVSGAEREDLEDRVREAGADALVRKPIRPATLRDVVGSLIP